MPRKREVEGGWTPELQREFIARLAVHGSPGRACEEMGKDRDRDEEALPLARAARASAPRGTARSSWPSGAGRSGGGGARRPAGKPPSLDNRREAILALPRPTPGSRCPGEVGHQRISASGRTKS